MWLLTGDRAEGVGRIARVVRGGSALGATRHQLRRAPAAGAVPAEPQGMGLSKLVKMVSPDVVVLVW